ncbi:MAG: cache domain-containing protein [Nitrososphaeraceae archaeon]
MGIPENADVLKREMAKRILQLDDNFGSVFFTTPKADIYLGEPFSQQEQLQRLNYADSEWYKGITNIINNNTGHNLTATTTNMYTSRIFISASIHTPAISISTPVYKKYDTNYSNNNYDELIGYWVGILNLKDIIKSIKNLNLKDNERIVIFDQNGTIVTDSKNDYYKNSTELKYFEYLDKMSNVLDGEKGVKVQNNNNNDNLPTLLVYYLIDIGSHYWGVIYMTY